MTTPARVLALAFAAVANGLDGWKTQSPLSVSLRWPDRSGTILALVGHFLIIVKFEQHDIRALMFGMGREVAIYRCIPVLV
jgi:hypothetical protein